MMTVQQLADWLVRATNTRHDSRNPFTGNYGICEIQALTQTKPTIASHGYFANEGELHIATALMFACPLNEIYEIADKCWVNTPAFTETGLQQVALDATPVPGVDPMPITTNNFVVEAATDYENFWGDIQQARNDELDREIAQLLATTPEIYPNNLPPPQANTEA